MDVDSILRAIGLSLCSYVALTAAVDRLHVSEETAPQIPENTVVPVYREIALQQHSGAAQPFWQFNINTVLLLIAIVILISLVDWISQRSLVRVRIGGAEGGAE